MKKFWISLIVCSICTFLMAWSRGIFTQTTSINVFHILSDSFLVVGMLATCIALLVFVSNEGMFDGIAYGLKAFWSFFRKDMLRKYDTFFDYREARKERKSPFLFLLACGGIFLLMAGLMYAFYYKCL